MTGILNHPKMPVVAGSLALALLAGGVYSSMEPSSPVALSVRKVDAAAKATFASSAKASAPASAPATVLVQTQPAAPASPSSSSRVVAPETQPATTAVQPVEPVRPGVDARPQPLAPSASTQVEPKRVVVEQKVNSQPVAPKLIVQPIMPAPSAPAPVASEAQPVTMTAVTVKPMPVARVTVPDEPAITAAPPATAATVAPVETVHQSVHQAEATVHVAPVARAAKVSAAKKKKKHHVVQEDDDTSAETSVPDKPITVKTETVKADTGSSDYTEIKGTATSDVLTQPRAATPGTPVAAAKPEPKNAYRPSVVASSGGQAWVKISPERTIVVKAGDNVPGLGKVSAVTGSAVETDTGKFSVNSKE